MRRRRMSRRSSRRSFSRYSGKRKKNYSRSPRRGGWRL